MCGGRVGENAGIGVGFRCPSIGASLSTIFKRNESPNLDIFSNPDILISSIGLFVLAIIPLVIKKIKKAR